MNSLRSGDIALKRIPGRRAFRRVIVIHVPPPAHAGGPREGQEGHGRVRARFPVLWMVPDGWTGRTERMEPEWMDPAELVRVGEVNEFAVGRPQRKEFEIL